MPNWTGDDGRCYFGDESGHDKSECDAAHAASAFRWKLERKFGHVWKYVGESGWGRSGYDYKCEFCGIGTNMHFTEVCAARLTASSVVTKSSTVRQSRRTTTQGKEANAMGFMDMVLKAKDQAKRDGDFIAANQRGTILIHSFAAHKGLSGKYVVLEGVLTECSPKTAGGPHQAAGTKVKIWTGLYGSVKKVEASYSNIRDYIKAVTGCSPDELAETMSVIFGDGEDGVAADASDKAKAHPGFGARGMLVDFDTYEKPDKDNKDKKYTRIKLAYRAKGNSDEEVLARQKDLPKIA